MKTKETTVSRLLKPPDRSFFLFGPRGVGKSTWLKQVLPEASHLDLLDASLFLELTRDPHRIEAMVGPKPAGAWIVIDEIQKAPPLLEETHRLMEARRWKFALCGSSARKLRRGGVNLLGGRAVTRHMEGFSAAELKESCDLQTAIEWGSLPLVVRDVSNAADTLSAYVNTYLKEEIREECLVRSISPFVRFLSVAGQLNGQTINGANIAREVGVPRSSVDGYFSILSDTLLGHFLPAYTPGLKVRERTHPKFYWFDSGVARAAAGMLRDPADRLWQGTALESLIFHELRVYNEVTQRCRPIAYYRTAAGVEIDFLIETRKRTADGSARVVCIEVKRSERWDRSWEGPMRDFAAQGGVAVDRMIGVYTGPRAYHFDGLDVLPVAQFIEQLHQGKVF